MATAVDVLRSAPSGAVLRAGLMMPDTYLAEQAAMLPVSEWVELTVSGLSSGMFIAGSTNVLDYMDKAGYDALNKQIRFFGQAHYDDQRFIQYDEAGNAWSVLVDPPWDDGGSSTPSFIGHGYQHNTIDPITGDQYYARFNDTTIHRREFATGSWTTLTRPAQGDITGAIEWLPEIGAAGGLICHFGTYCQRWDKAANSWTTPESGTLTGQLYHTVAVRSVPNSVVVFGGGNGSRNFWKIGASGGATAVVDCPIDAGIGSAVVTACPVSGDVIVIGGNSSCAALDVAAGTWSTFSLDASAPSFGTISTGSGVIATSIPTYGVISFLLRTGAHWLFKYSE